MSTNSVTLHRVLKATPKKVYRAFTETNALAAWLPPYGFLGVVHEMNARGGKFLEITPNEFLKYTDNFDNPNMSGEMITSVWLKKVSVGTELKVTQQNIPAAIPAEMCYLGWQEFLEKLIKLIEPAIPDI